MKKKTFIVIGLSIVVMSVYLNRSYTHIYNKINQMKLQSSDIQHIYNFGKDSGSKIVYVAIGDSLTSGVGVDSFEKSYPYQVAEKISDSGKKVILNVQAVPGARSIDIVNQFLDSTIKLQPDLITVFVGVNDVHGNISKKEFKNNYETILKRLTQETKAKIYIINIPYIGNKDLIWPPYNFYFDNQTREFNDILKELAVDYKINYVDLYNGSKQSFEKDNFNYSVDLFHPSYFGYKLWSQIIYDGLNK